jgi:hypothetical protein
MVTASPLLSNPSWSTLPRPVFEVAERHTNLAALHMAEAAAAGLACVEAQLRTPTGTDHGVEALARLVKIRTQIEGMFTLLRKQNGDEVPF